MGVGCQRYTPAALPPGRTPGTLWIGERVGSWAGLDGCGKSHPHRDSISGPSSPYRVAILTAVSRFIVLFYAVT